MSDCSLAAGLWWTVHEQRDHCTSLFPNEVHRWQRADGSTWGLGHVLHRCKEGTTLVCFVALVSYFSSLKATETFRCWSYKHTLFVFLGYRGRLWSMYSVSTPRLAPEKSAGPLSVPMVNQTSSDYVVSLIQATAKKKISARSQWLKTPIWMS